MTEIDVLKVIKDLASTCPTDSEVVAPLPLQFQVQNTTSNIGGDSFGVFATQSLKRGDMILAEQAYITVDKAQSGVTLDLLRDVQYRIQASPPALREHYMRLCSNPHIPVEMCYLKTSRIFCSNAFTIERGTQIGIFLIASRFNHSCSPNARYCWHASGRCMRIYAVRDIQHGEEIVVTYLPGAFSLTREQRRTHLWETHRFWCTCHVCTLDEFATVQSDHRRAQLANVQESVLASSPEEALLSVLEALRLLKEELYYADADEFTHIASQISAHHSDWTTSRFFAYLTYKTRVDEFGADSDCATMVGKYVMNPRVHEEAGRGLARDFSFIRHDE